MKYCKIYISLLLLGVCHLSIGMEQDLKDLVNFLQNCTGGNALVEDLLSHNPGNPRSPKDPKDLEYFLYKDKGGNIQREYLIPYTPVKVRSSPSDVTYIFFSKANPIDGVEVNINNIEKLARTSFRSWRETIFVIHGWLGSREADVNSYIRRNLLRYHNVNIFVVDWSPIAGDLYVFAQSQVRKVGEYVADFVRSLINVYSLQLDRLTLVGHSLGAHICGNAGAALNGQVETIVGFDPAGPLFIASYKDNRIDKDDAINVQIIHTNGGRLLKLGYYDPCGDSDFYPNGGRTQRGCECDLTGICSHSRSYELYAESLTTGAFVAQRCDSYSDYEDGKCYGPKVSMGMFPIDKNASGTYYLNTNSQSPYARG
ncbi:pancreatic lipase-related protein 2-like [Diabrotica virgifera virgifera]|uniref:Pancreatic lipase-related protein 2-like n=1 Tax=Diabrotica virgifera virgifera TaxID=50390 RepID=A0A6P7F350_DIAVI|nr:pancreatic lipase-related protein 2-like [Diabrotica virgifera virgifera]